MLLATTSDTEQHLLMYVSSIPEPSPKSLLGFQVSSSEEACGCCRAYKQVKASLQVGSLGSYLSCYLEA
jgi:hypothetical protein